MDQTVPAPHKVAVLVGSLRTASFSRQIARAISHVSPGLECGILDIGNLPLYNEDLDQGSPPPDWTEFRDLVRAADAVLFVTPEYNRSIPGVLKNAIDVGSRPYGKSAFAKKPAGVVSVTPGPLGAFGANHHLRQCLVFLDMPTLQAPEAYIANVGKLLDDEGRVTSADTEAFLKKFGDAFTAWIGSMHAKVS